MADGDPDPPDPIPGIESSSYCSSMSSLLKWINFYEQLEELEMKKILSQCEVMTIKQIKCVSLAMLTAFKHNEKNQIQIECNMKNWTLNFIGLEISNTLYRTKQFKLSHLANVTLKFQHFR
jgi:hypothetical protein